MHTLKQCKCANLSEQFRNCSHSCKVNLEIVINLIVLRTTVLPVPVDSILEAVFTVSPNKQYLGILSPTTPATHGPGD